VNSAISVSVNWPATSAGGAINIPGGGSYHEYLIGGMLGMGLAQTAPGTAVAVVSDMSTGLIDRFRSLPMSPPSAGGCTPAPAT
jgi:hypothetical protein